MKQEKNGYFYALSQGLLFGIIPIVIQSGAAGEGIPNSMGIMCRYMVAAVVLLPLAFRRICRAMIPPRIISMVFAASLFMSASSVLLYSSYAFIPTGVGITLHYMYPVFTMIASILFFRVKPGRQMVLSMVLSFCGIIYLCDAGAMSATAVKGGVFALSSAVTFTVYLLWTEHKKLNNLGPVVLVSLTSGFNFLILLVYNLATRNFVFALPAKTKAFFTAGGFLAVFALLALTLAIKYAGAVHTSILGTLEPITCTIGGAVVLSEKISFRTVLGSALVIAAVILAASAKKQE